MEPPGGKKSYEQLTVDLLQRLEAGGILTDVNPGSVVRTLTEAFARQLALAYGQLSLIYEMGFIDTAEGGALDHLVALLGQTRRTGPQAVGEARFSRDPRVAGQVIIAESTALQLVLARLPGQPISYFTRRESIMAAGQKEMTVEVYADLPVDAAPETVLLQAGDLPAPVTLVAPVAGVGSVTIHYPTSVRGHAESDPDLRARVKGLIGAAGGGTPKALEHAALSSGLARALALRDAQDAPPEGGRPLQPGELEVVADMGESPERQSDLRQALIAAKGPGIYLRFRQIDRLPLTLNVVLQLVGTPGAEQRDAIRTKAEEAVRQTLEALQPGEKLRWNPIMAALLRLDGVADVNTATITPWKAGEQQSLPKVELVKQGATQLAEYPAGEFPKYARLVPAEIQPPVVIDPEQGKTIYIGIKWEALPLTLLEQTRLDAGQFKGTVADELEQYLEKVNRAMSKAMKETGGAGPLPKLQPLELKAAIDKPFGSYAPASFQITYWDPQGGLVITLETGDDPVAFSGQQVLRPAPESVIIGRWESGA